MVYRGRSYCFIGGLVKHWQMMASDEVKITRMRAAVNGRLIPHILASGFQPDGRPIWEQNQYGHLFRRFLRRHGEKLELLEIQFDKQGRAAFVLNFGAAPPEGVLTYGEHRPQAGTAFMHLPLRARLYAGRALRMRWFGLPWMRIPLLRDPTADQIVEKAIRLFPQIEAWLREGVEGPNVRVLPGVTP